MTVEAEAAAGAGALVAAIQSGDIDSVRWIVADAPDLARVPLGGPFKTRTALHVASDWARLLPQWAPDRSATHSSRRGSELPRP